MRHAALPVSRADASRRSRASPGTTPGAKLAKAPALHPLQQAVIDEQAAQCGYCYNGMIVKGAELLAKTPKPTEAQIRTAMNGHLCRCGTYPRVMAAIQRALGDDGGGTAMSALTLPRREFLKAGGALVIGFSIAAWRSASSRTQRPAASPSRARPIRNCSTRGSPFTPTTRRRSTSGTPSSARARAPRCCRSPPRSSTST